MEVYLQQVMLAMVGNIFIAEGGRERGARIYLQSVQNKSCFQPLTLQGLVEVSYICLITKLTFFQSFRSLRYVALHD